MAVALVAWFVVVRGACGGSSSVCDEDSAAQLAWQGRLLNATESWSGEGVRRWDCVEGGDPTACLGDTLAGCCVGHVAAAVPVSVAPHRVMISISSSDGVEHVERLAENAANFSSGAVVLHVGCACRGRWCTREARSALARSLAARLGPRAALNPKCVPTRAGFGSVLHAHLLNVAFAKALEPSHVIFQSSDMEWFASPDDFVKTHGSSTAVLAGVDPRVSVSHL